MQAKPHSTLVAGACAVLLSLSAGGALAQTSTGVSSAPSGYGMQQPGMQGQWHAMSPEQRQQARDQAFQKRAAALRQKLGITPDQEGAWSNFQQAMQPANRTRGNEPRTEWKQLSTPERIDRMRQMRDQRSAEQDRRGDAIKTFYAALRPEQQKTFDSESARMMSRHFGHGKPHGPAGGARGGAQPQTAQ